VGRRFNSSILERAKYLLEMSSPHLKCTRVQKSGEDLMTMKYAQIAISKEHSIESCN
jgi:hypothetical protein